MECGIHCLDLVESSFFPLVQRHGYGQQREIGRGRLWMNEGEVGMGRWKGDKQMTSYKGFPRMGHFGNLANRSSAWGGLVLLRL